MVEFPRLSTHRLGVHLLVVEHVGISDNPGDKRIGLNLIRFGLKVHHRRDDLGQQTKLLPVNVAILAEISVAFTDGQQIA